MEIKYFGQYLIENNHITNEQLLEAIRYQKENNLSLSEFCLQNGYLTQTSHDKVLSYQFTHNVSFIKASTRLNLIPPDKMEQILARQISDNLLLGDAVVDKGYMSKEALDKIFKDFRKDQSMIELNIIQAISDHENSELINIIIQSTSNLFRYMIDSQPRIGGFKQHIDYKINGFDCMSSQVIKGDYNVELEFYFSQKLVIRLSSALLKREIKEYNELSKDASKEFINIVIGYICQALSLKNAICETDVPELNDDLTTVEKKNRIYIPLLVPEGEFQIAIIF